MCNLPISKQRRKLYSNVARKRNFPPKHTYTHTPFAEIAGLFSEVVAVM